MVDGMDALNSAVAHDQFRYTLLEDQRVREGILRLVMRDDVVRRQLWDSGIQRRENLRTGQGING
ncbi:hypothetical protein ASZ90_015459 [hydrocarbon metagenome]|uniref:Uncharacterized protein n=1 Tax=hydrocarbon metagenome TaxID=938273 RepID=A0A0W8F245_9ZZZZ